MWMLYMQTHPTQHNNTPVFIIFLRSCIHTNTPNCKCFVVNIPKEYTLKKNTNLLFAQR